MEPGSYKVVVLGSAGSGKTSLINRFVYGQMSSNYISTLPTAMYTKTVEIDGGAIRLQIWDWVGGDKYFEKLARSGFLIGSHGAILVYDSSSGDLHSALRMEELFAAVREVESLRCIAVVGNKRDNGINTAAETTVSGLLSRIRSEFDGTVFRVDISSKDDTGVADLFTKVASSLISR